MEERIENNEIETEAQPEGYTPRPAWQLWAARIGLVLFIILVMMQIISIARGGI